MLCCVLNFDFEKMPQKILRSIFKLFLCLWRLRLRGEGQFYNLNEIWINNMQLKNFLSCYTCISGLSLVELHRCTKIKLDGQKTDHIHLVDCDPISASRWQRKENISSCWVSPDSHVRITEWIQLALGRQQRDRCSLVLTADPKWSCITLPASYHTCSSFLCVLPLWDIALWIRAQLVLELFYPNFLWVVP